MKLAGARSQRGFALVLTLWVLSALSILLLTFAMQVRTNVRAAGYQRARVQAEFVARSAIARIAVELADPETESPEPGTGSAGGGTATSAGDAAATGGPEGPAGESQPEWRLGTWRLDPSDWSIVARPGEPAPRPRRGDRGPREIVCEVTAEEAMLPLAKIWPPIAERLGLPDPEAPFALREDLLALRAAPDRRVREAIDALYPWVTTFTQGRVFVNGAGREVLERIPGIDAMTAAALIDRVERQGPFASVAEIADVVGVTPAETGSLEDWFTVQPRFFRIRPRSADGPALEAIVEVDGPQVRIVRLGAGVAS